MKNFKIIITLFCIVLFFSKCSNQTPENIQADFVNPMNSVGEQHNEGLKIVLNSFIFEDNINTSSKNSNFKSNEIKVKVEQIIKTKVNLNSIS
jgi:PBP1b-binding outer membrane lipoprotein LpoB